MGFNVKEIFRKEIEGCMHYIHDATSAVCPVSGL